MQCGIDRRGRLRVSECNTAAVDLQAVDSQGKQVNIAHTAVLVLGPVERVIDKGLSRYRQKRAKDE